MPLKVQFQGKAYALPFKGSSTIISVKEAVIQRAKVPVTPSSFSLYFDGCELGDEDTLDDLDIKDKDILVDHSGEESSSTSTSRDESTTSNQPKIRVTIKSLGRSYKTVEVDPNSTIAQLAHQIIKIEGLENKGLFCQLFTDRMPIFYNGQTKDLNLTQIGLRNDQTVYAFFIKQELVPNMYTMNSEVQLFYQFSDYWKVQIDGIEDPSEQAISTFICTLHSLRHILIDMTIFSHAHFFQTLRRVLDFPPAVLAFYHIIFGTGMNFEKSLITEALMYYFRQVLPLSVSDKNILHEAPIVWAQLFSTTDVTTCEPDFYSTLNIVGWDGELLKEPVYIPGTDRLKLEDKTTLIKVQSTGEIEPVPDIKCLIQVLISTNQNHLSEYVCWDSSTDLSKKENIARWSSKDYEEYWKILTKKDIFKGLCFAPGDQTEDHIMAVEATGTTVYLTGKMKGSEGYNVFAPSLRTQTIQLAELKSGNDFDVLKKPKSSSDRRNRMIDQIDMIMLDVSASMNAISYKDGTTSIEAAKVYFGALVDKLIGLDLAHAVGLLCFGENLRETSPISTDFERLSTNLGSIAADEGATELYYAIERVVERIVEFENKNKNWLHKNYKKRIFCLTDGEDNSNNKPHKIAQYLQLHNVMLDCVTIGPKGSVLKCISSASGGWCFKVDSVQSGLALFESEPVLSTRERKPLDHDPVAVKDEKSLLEHKDESKYPHISKPERKIPDLTRKAVGHDKGVLGTKEEELGNPAQKKSFSTSGRPKRILLEFSKCHKHKFKQFTAFMDEVDFSFWKIIYTGETGTPYSGGHWLMYIQFPEDYPMSAPTIRFETKIYHCNVNNDGKICHEILSTSWSPLISMVDILQNISDMLKEPNFDDALDSVKGALYKDDKAKYNEEAIRWKQQYASTKLEQLMLRYKLE